MPDGLLDRRALQRHAPIEPLQRGIGARILIAEPFGQLSREQFGDWSGGACGDVGLERGPRAAGREQPVGQKIGVGAGRSRDADLIGEPSQILDEDYADRDRYGPEFTDRERLHSLIGGHETLQDLWIEVAVGVGDIGPGEAEYTRIAPERSSGKLR
ncbi:hypothetical protein ACIKTA_03025 [Hansschlegelia beijingensis]